MSDLVNLIMSSSNLTMKNEIEFSMNLPNHLLTSPYINSKKSCYSLLDHYFSLLVNSIFTEKNTMYIYSFIKRRSNSIKI